MLRVLIADDDPYMRIILRKAVSQGSDVQVIAEAENGTELIQSATALTPDVVFVDIDMPEIDGLQAARTIAGINPDTFIVFATAHDSYTHEAFEIYAFDYLVKPFNVSRIAQTIERIKKAKGERGQSSSSSDQAKEPKKRDFTICVTSHNKQHFIKSQDIILITRSKPKTIIHTKHDTIETREGLSDVGQKLGEDRFFRCHKGYIINIDKISEIVLWGKKTYLVRFVDTKETALMTLEKAREFRAKFGSKFI